MKPQKSLIIACLSLLVNVSSIAKAKSATPALTELELLKHVPADVLIQTREGRPDTNGLVGNNQKGTFVANDQRSAMTLLEVGIALNNDKDVADAWRAVEATYKRQTAQGDFGPATNSNTANSMNFWMAWSNHAILLLKNSSYGSAYANRIAALTPKIEKAMDYLMLAASKDKLHKADNHSPNRTLINVNAYGFGSLLLEDYTAKTKRDAYLAEAKAWLKNEFDSDRLYRSADGVFKESNGYDTSYQGVATWMFLRYQIYFPDATLNADIKGVKAGNWLEKRILPDGTVDCTYNTRSGPNNAVGDAKSTDTRAIKRALIYWAAMFNKPEGYGAAKRLGQSVNGLPPVVFSDLTARATVDRDFSYTIMVTNAGLDSPSPSFSISVKDLPAGLATSSLEFSRSTGTLKIIGTPKVRGSFLIPISVKNSYGQGATVNLNLTVQ